MYLYMDVNDARKSFNGRTRGNCGKPILMIFVKLNKLGEEKIGE